MATSKSHHSSMNEAVPSGGWSTFTTLACATRHCRWASRSASAAQDAEAPAGRSCSDATVRSTCAHEKNAVSCHRARPAASHAPSSKPPAVRARQQSEPPQRRRRPPAAFPISQAACHRCWTGSRIDAADAARAKPAAYRALSVNTSASSSRDPPLPQPCGWSVPAACLAPPTGGWRRMAAPTLPAASTCRSLIAS